MTACAVCGSTALEPAYEVRDLVLEAPGAWSFARCANCGHGQLAPLPTDEALSALYASLYTPERVGWMEQIGASGWERDVQRWRAEAISGAFGEAGPTVLVDVGCGLGHFLGTLARVFPSARVVGVEVNPAAAATARGRDARIEVIERPFHELEPFEGGVDALSMNHLLEHLPDPAAALRGAARWVRPGGVIEVEVPRGDGLGPRVFGRWWWGHLPPQHLHLLSRDGLVRLLAEAGFTEVIAERTTAYPFPFVVALVLWVRFTVGSRSAYARNWLVRGPVVLGGFALLPSLILLDVVVMALSGLMGWGDVITVVARRARA